MKRKFKLFATVASLCLSVALMAFGVYAASTVTYTVSGSVTYTMTDVLVKLTTKTEYVTDEHAGYADGAVTELTYANSTEVGSYTSYDDDELATVPGATDSQTQNVTVNFNTSTAWKITVTVATINPTGVEVASTNATFGLTGGENFGVVAATANSYGTQITDTADYVFYVYLKDPTIAVASANFSIVLNVTQYVAD